MAERSDIDEVRARIDIVSVVEKYVTLKRAAGKLKGLCPFHQEKTPSFVVSPEIGRWHCFGSCSEGGDVFKFVQKIENLSFPEALERLALQANVTLTEWKPRADTSVGSGSAPVSPAGERERLYQVNALALRFYRDTLRRSPVAREYLQERGLAHAIQEAFSIGYAADEWDGLCRFLSQQGANLADAEKAGLLAQGEHGYYDRLRGRLIFPILDVQNRPIAFGGRLIAEARPGQPKYWNSPETPIFSKSKTLYGLPKARKAMADRQQAVVVEGYTDVVACHQAGIENVVATLGTSLTEEHVQILARLSSTVLLAFDADSAGLKAAGRAAQIFEAQEVEVRVLDLPQGEDPDSLLRSGRERIFALALEEALPLTEYRIQRLIRQGPIESERDRVLLFKKAMPILATVPSILEREQYVKLLAPYHPQYSAGAAFAEEHIRQDVASHMNGQSTAHLSGQRDRQPWGGRRPAPMLAPPTGGGATEQAERHLLRALVSEDPALMGRALQAVTPADFVSERSQHLASALFDYYERLGTLEAREVLAALGDDPRADLLADLLMNSDEPLTDELVAGAGMHLKSAGKASLFFRLKQQIDAGTADVATIQQFQRLLSERKGTPKSALSLEG